MVNCIHLGVRLTTLCALATLGAAQISFQTAVNYAVGTSPDSVAVGDFNADGKLDLAATGETPDSVSILTNQGNGAFTLTATVLTGANTSPAGIVAGQFDNDGDVDLAVAFKGTNQVAILVNSSGAFTLGPTFNVGLEPRNIVAGYVDSDLSLDIAVSERTSNSVSVLRNLGSLSFGVGSYLAGQSPRELELADVNGDGRNDLIVASHDTHEIVVLGNVGNGQFAPLPVISLGMMTPEGLTVGRLDGDTWLDIAAAGDENGVNTIRVALNQGSGAFPTAPPFPASGAGASSLIAADFDLDGDRDLACCNAGSANVSVLTGDGAGGYSAAQLFGVGAGPAQIVSGDLEGNGARDVVTVNELGGNVSVLINQTSIQNCAVIMYCESKQTSLGTLPRIGSTGTPSATLNNFVLTVSNAIPNAPGLAFYGFSGRAHWPFQDGVLCAKPPFIRLPEQQMDPTGSMSYSIPVTGPLVGTTHWYQFWFRDATVPSTTGLSNALEVHFCN
jgi:hypothetical protein